MRRSPERIVQSMRTADGEVYEGWWVVIAAGAVVMLIAGFFFYGFGTFFTEFQDEFGWTAAATSIGFSLRSEVGGIAAPLVGWALDRYPPRRLLQAGLVVTAIGCAAMSAMQELWHFYVAMLFIATGNTASGGQVGQYVVATWFRQRRAFAISLMTFGGALGGALAALVAVIIEQIGWRSTLRLMAVVLVIAAFSYGPRVRRRPEDHHQPLDGDATATQRASDHEIPFREAIRSRAFALLNVATVCTDFVRVAFVVHVAAHIEIHLGGTKSYAGLALLAFAIASAPGRVIVGWFADRLRLRYVLAATMLPFCVGLPILALSTKPWHAMVAVLVIAPGFGGSIPLRAAIYADYFGISVLGRVLGIGRLVSTTGGAIGAWVLGVVIDGSGYPNAWWLAFGLAALAVPTSLFATPPTGLQQEYALAGDGADDADQPNG